MDLNTLVSKIEGCTLCAAHLPHGVRPVVQVSEQAPILIAGQAPGRKVHETGVPFDDASGDRLRDWLGIDKETFYDSSKIAILPMGFCYPGTGKSGDLPPRSECAPAWREALMAAMPSIRLTLVVGQYALKWHMPAVRNKSLTEVVKGGADFIKDGYLPLPHPSPRNNIWLAKNPWFERDILPVLQAATRALLK